MKYQVLHSGIAENQLTDILRYITQLTGDTQSALNLLDELEKAAAQLENFPESGTVPRDITIRKSGYRYLIIGNYFLFYKVDHTQRTVTIYSFLYMKSDYKHLL
ncbi:MAG: type II toxin-antitoxin system RelE/ParE family toxin [Anaerolineaceae bacterium]|nr:type II toxin-antitoxin system RelE/ParE family toxin [Anaerolineaceae bacterium]